ncbi:hypothetical protein VTK26DRAFT_7780 [Humicola hyalothermophila]
MLAHALEVDSTEWHLFRQFVPNTHRRADVVDADLLPNQRIINAPAKIRNYPNSSLTVQEITTSERWNLAIITFSSFDADVASVRRRISGCLAGLYSSCPELFHFHCRPHVLLSFYPTSYGLTVPVSAIQDGFYNKLNKLNGHRSTIWTGAAF